MFLKSVLFFSVRCLMTWKDVENCRMWHEKWLHAINRRGGGILSMIKGEPRYKKPNFTGTQRGALWGSSFVRPTALRYLHQEQMMLPWLPRQQYRKHSISVGTTSLALGSPTSMCSGLDNSCNNPLPCNLLPLIFSLICLSTQQEYQLTRLCKCLPPCSQIKILRDLICLGLAG